MALYLILEFGVLYHQILNPVNLLVGIGCERSFARIEGDIVGNDLILDREVYLALWIVIFTLLGLYLLGKIRFKYDEPREHVSILRLLLSIGVFSFVVYLVPGMWGAPLKGLSGYLPPIETQDFVLGSGAVVSSSGEGASGNTYGLKIAHGLDGYFTLEEGLEAAQATGKPIFVDVTGHGCV